MRLDMPTLMLVLLAVNLIIGLLFLTSWNGFRSDRALAYWGWSYVARGIGIAVVMTRDHLPDLASVGLGNALILCSTGLFWSGARTFGNRRPCVAATALGPVSWLFACAAPAFLASPVARMWFLTLVMVAYGCLATYEFFRERWRRLPSLYPLIALIVVALVAYAVTLATASTDGRWNDANPYTAPDFATTAFFLIVVGLMRATLLLNLLRERMETELRQLAETDLLTGIGNRRAVIRRSQRLLADPDVRVALLAFDIDHFKSVNDRFGHAVGDAVLVAFCSAVQTLLPEAAVFGRLGGEEFGVILVEADSGDGLRLAELVRAAMAATVFRDRAGLRVTVSAGVARSASCGRSFDTLMMEADRALYAAKHSGRNIVVAAETFHDLQAA